MTAEAVSAVHRTASGGNHQSPAVILVEQAGRCPEARIRNGIRDESGDGLKFVVQRQNLSQQRVVGISGRHPRKKAARHHQRKLACSSFGESLGELIQSEFTQQFGGLANGVCQ
jgi:hypothetical protein